MKLIVTAGGQGTKIWPYSRENKPKQFQRVVGDKTLLEYTIDLLLQQHDPKDIVISTKKRYEKFVKEQAPKIPAENYIFEPDAPKNRGPAEGLAFLWLSVHFPDEPFMIIQPDCIRMPEENWLKMITEAEKLVERDKKFITGGNKATYPVLGIDYMKLGKKVDTGSNLEVFEVEEFVERNNDYYKTKELVENFYITTHSNHACWYPSLMLEAYKKHKPDWYEALMEIKEHMGKENYTEKLNEIYETMERGATEVVTKNIFSEGYMILCPFKWTDLGTWNSVYEYFAKDDETYTDGNVLVVKSKSSIVKNENKEKLVAVYGVDDLAVVDTDDVLLVVPRDKAGEIGEILQKIRKKNLGKYL